MKRIALLSVLTTFALSLAVGLTPPRPGAASDEKLGKVSFPVSCRAAVQKPFERAVALLHSFWYLEAHKAFNAVAQADPDCAIAHWGAAMTLWYQLWAPARPQALVQGLASVEKAKAIGAKTPRERDFIAAAEAFFRDHDKLDHRTRAVAYEKAMEQAYARHPGDTEVAVFYALALQATADPHDKTYAKQRRSGEIAEKIFAAEPDHPGAAHYVIHAYDYPKLAARAKAAADRYAKFVPSAPHALHMPSHIYVLLGHWSETIDGNVAAAEAERTKGDADGQMHALDYLVYAHLQRGEDAAALKVLNDGRRIVADLAARKYDSGRHTSPFAISAMEARYAMERGNWAEAAALEPRSSRFPYADSHVVFARAIGAARTGQAAQARAETDKLAAMRDALTQAKNGYWAEQVEIQRRGAAAWAARAEGKNEEALALMRSAAELEESTEKHNITPGPIVTARELLGELLVDLKQPGPALREYETALQVAPNRFRAYYGAARAAELAGDREKAKTYYAKLVQVASPTTTRPEIKEARAFLAR